MVARIWRGAADREDGRGPGNLPIGRQPGIWIKADVDWLVPWFNWKFEAWTPLRPDFCVQCHNPGGKRQI
jgi:hypothetical protein